MKFSYEFNTFSLPRFWKSPEPTIERIEDEGKQIDENPLSILRDSKCFERYDETEVEP